MLNKEEDLNRPRIGVDLLGCETPGQKLLAAILNTPFEEKHPPKFTFFGSPAIFSAVPVPDDHSCIEVSEEITMEEDPLAAIRKKKDSSIVVGIHQLKDHSLDAFISAGNTGALFASAKIALPALPGIKKPALLTLIPTKQNPISVLDVGANVHVKAEDYLQFAKMGIAYQKAKGIENPTVGLLNIGVEEKKGTEELQKAYKILQKLNDSAPLDNPIFLGNIEGRDVFRGNIDVLITDGFTGNVFLKTSEGIASFILEEMHKLGPLASIPKLKSVFDALHSHLFYAEYPGALLCGVDGIVMKCHGESPPEAFINSIKGCHRLVKHFFIEKLKKELYP